MGGFFLPWLLLCLFFFFFFHVLLLWPRKVRSKLAKQGIRGPPPANFFIGNIPQMNQLQHHPSTTTTTTTTTPSHAWTSKLFPFLHNWITQYGPIFLYSTGSLQLLSITDVELVKELGLHASLDLGKPSYLSKDRGPLLGQGILSSTGPLWAHQRKIIAPEFYIHRVKNMVHMMGEATDMLISSWEADIENKGGVAEMRVDEGMRCLSADIISRACFGSSYHHRGEQIFSKLRTLQNLMSKGNIGIPLSRHLPTRNNRQIWRLEREIRRMILEVVRERTETSSSEEKDLLQMILEGAESLEDLDGVPDDFSKDKFIVDSCKNIYFAGHETTAVTTSWALLLLAAHPEWQDRARAEVIENGSLDSNTIRNLKTLTMVIQETLRLYPPAVFVVREASRDMNFKAIQIPNGVVLQIPIPILHHSPELWGPDAHEFNPERFADGVTVACKVPQAYMPFGLGAHTCAGQHFAMAEMKVILGMLLSKFEFSVSPAYSHSPAFRLVIVPENGISLLVSLSPP